MQLLVTTWYLDYQGPAINAPVWPEQTVLIEAKIASPELNQFMFCAVGTPWHWFSRLSWTYQDWQRYLLEQQVRTWVLYQQGTPAGYIELIRHADLSVEVKFFGLMPTFIGQGLGHMLAQAAIYWAQQWSAGRVWLHTCSEDHPSALKTYQQAGFVVVQQQQELEPIPQSYAQAALAEPFVRSRLELFSKV